MKTLSLTSQVVIWMSVIFFSHLVRADPTEIFFSASQNKAKTNLLFVLDNSNTMYWAVGNTGKSRMQTMQEVFRNVMQQSSSELNVGLMRFGGDYLKPAANGVAFPISPIDASAYSIIKDYINIDNLPNPTSTITVRDFLPDIADSWLLSNGTPIVDSLYEASLYYRGGPVTLGKYKPDHTRAAHPSSYTGTLNGCVGYDKVKCLLANGVGGCPSNVDRSSCATKYSYNTPRQICKTNVCVGSSGNATYKSPIQYACQANYTVLMTDGIPTDSAKKDVIQQDILKNTQQNCVNNPNGFDGGTCGPELTKYLSEHDIAPQLDGKQTIETFTIGFGLGGGGLEDEEDDASASSDDKPEKLIRAHEYLQSLASPGGGFYAAENAEELTNAFLDIINKVNKGNLSFSPPSYSLSNANALAHGEYVYIPVLDYAITPLWKGNLRKLKRKKGILLDKNDKPAVDDMGNLVEGAMDLWSKVASGDKVTEGGAAALLNPDTRSLWTDINNQLVPLEKRTQAISASLFGLEDDGTQGGKSEIEEKRNTYLDFVRGYDKEGQPRYHMGDMLHSKPLVFSYNKGKEVIFAATNEGYLHAFDAETGREKWAFMPSRLLKNTPIFYENSANRTHVYGIDGELSFWENDIDRNGDIEPNKGEGIYVFFGLGRGGNAYYALDITNADKPQLVWKINGEDRNNDTSSVSTNNNNNSATTPRFASGGDNNDFHNLGETWSKPILGKMYTGSRSEPSLTYVLIFGGGYDPVKDEANPNKRSSDQLGKDVFIVDALTGKRIWSLSKDAKIMGANTLKHSVTGDIRVLDLDHNGSLDRLYFADTGGNVWRVDMDVDIKDEDESLYDYGDAQVSLFANISDSSSEGDRMFFNSPDVSMMYYKGKPVLFVSIGSGYRMHPLDQRTKNYFFVMKDDYVYQHRPSSAASLTIGFNSIVPAKNLNGKSLLDTNYKGWYKELAFAGEKVLSDSVTFMNKVMFTTFSVTDEDGNTQDYSDICNPPKNTSRAYVLDIFTGKPAVDLNRNGQMADEGDAFIAVGSGLVDTPQLVFLEPSAKDGGECKKDDCQQLVEVRAGTLKLPLIDVNNSSNESITKSVDLSLIKQKIYWRTED